MSGVLTSQIQSALMVSLRVEVIAQKRSDGPRRRMCLKADFRLICHFKELIIGSIKAFEKLVVVVSASLG